MLLHISTNKLQKIKKKPNRSSSRRAKTNNKQIKFTSSVSNLYKIHQPANTSAGKRHTHTHTHTDTLPSHKLVLCKTEEAHCGRQSQLQRYINTYEQLYLYLCASTYTSNTSNSIDQHFSMSFNGIHQYSADINQSLVYPFDMAPAIRCSMEIIWNQPSNYHQQQQLTLIIISLMLVDNNIFDGYFFIIPTSAILCVVFDYSFDCNRKNVFDHKVQRSHHDLYIKLQNYLSLFQFVGVIVGH